MNKLIKRFFPSPAHTFLFFSFFFPSPHLKSSLPNQKVKRERGKEAGRKEKGEN